MRWGEEVDLLEEEMCRVQHFLLWRSDWWKAQVGGRELLGGPQLEGETAYESTAAEPPTLPGLIQQGRAGELEEDGKVEQSENKDEDEEGKAVMHINGPKELLLT
ncbi:hypothetical protein B0H10DRAFT_2240660 [Mycena sp. CBHHK59/15]|nr:hypothetical protein B0H10DRAFT_2240660 [Mycena sp. CBHHK59/15]